MHRSLRLKKGKTFTTRYKQPNFATLRLGVNLEKPNNNVLRGRRKWRLVLTISSTKVDRSLKVVQRLAISAEGICQAKRSGVVWSNVNF